MPQPDAPIIAIICPGLAKPDRPKSTLFYLPFGEIFCSVIISGAVSYDVEETLNGKEPLLARLRFALAPMAVNG